MVADNGGLQLGGGGGNLQRDSRGEAGKIGDRIRGAFHKGGEAGGDRGWRQEVSQWQL